MLYQLSYVREARQFNPDAAERAPSPKAHLRPRFRLRQAGKISFDALSRREVSRRFYSEQRLRVRLGLNPEDGAGQVEVGLRRLYVRLPRLGHQGDLARA
jgi:hypothetical protein